MQDVEASTLSDVEFFGGLDKKSRRLIEGKCRWRRYAAGQQILDRGSTSRDVYIIVQGAVRVINYASSGREITFDTVGEGGFFGELAAIDGLPRSASVSAAEDTLLTCLPAKAFLEYLRTDGDFAVQVLRRVVRIVRACDERIMDLSTLGAVQRVYMELLRKAVPDAAVPGLWVVRPLPPMREIASRISTSRETVARAVSQLRQTSLVRRKGKNL